MSEVNTRIPPNSLEAEQSILGSMFLSENCVLEAVEALKEEDFYAKRHRLIFRAMYDLVSVNKPVDLVTVTERMEINGKLSLEELQYMSELTQRVPSTRNLKYYIDIVRSKSTLRSLIDACGEIADLAFKGEMPAEEIVGIAGDLIYRIAEDKSARSLEHIRKALLESLNLMKQASESDKGLMGLSTGFPLMDKTLAGLQPAQLIVVAARPGVGKTSFALNVAEHVALNEQRTVAIFSLEMSREQLATRLLCGKARVDSQKARIGDLKDDDFVYLADAMGMLGATNLYVDDTPTINVTEMLAKLRQLKRKTGDLGLVIIDYLQLMNGSGKAENRQQEISQITRAVKIMTRELQVPVMLLSQLSREAERDKRPKLSHLRESGAIEQDADVVLFLHREDYAQNDEGAMGRSFIIIAKQRSGPTGTIEVQWKGEQTKYEELDFYHEGEEI